MDKVIFNKEEHRYTLLRDNGEKIDLVSVTQLLAKHGLTSDYSAVDTDVLAKKAERGSIVHEELERYVKYGEIGFTGELQAFIDLCKEKKIKPLKSEFIVFNDEIAGTVDVAGIIGENELPFIGDYKTTAHLNQESVAWQLSLYAYLNNEEIFEKYLVFHFSDANTCKMVEIMPIPESEIEKLLECERNCELYQKKTLELAAIDCEKIIAVQRELKSLDDRKKELETQENELKTFLVQKMEETGVKQIVNDYFKITYIASSERTTIDSAKLKQEMPDVARQYSRISISRPTVRITLKG